MSSTERSLSLVITGIVGLAAALGIVAGFVWGVPGVLLVGAAAALSITIIAMWTSLQHMGQPEDMSFEQALFYAAPTITEEQKRALIRTLKDLEYERSVGKISEEDYLQVSADVRQRAKEAIALSDEVMRDRLEAAEKRWERHAERDARKPQEAVPDDGKKTKRPRKDASGAAEQDNQSSSPTRLEGKAKDSNKKERDALTSNPDIEEEDE